MKPKRCAERPSRTRLVRFRDVPVGTICMDLDGFWGVKMISGMGKSHSAFALDRWQAPACVLRPNDYVLQPY